MKKEIKFVGLTVLALAGSALWADAPAPEQEKSADGAPAPAVAAVQPAQVAVAAPEKAPEDLWAFLPDKVAEINGVAIPKQAIIDQLMKEFPDGKLPAFVNADMLKQLAPQLVHAYVYGELMKAALDKSGIKPSEEAAKAFLQQELLALSPEDRNAFNAQLAAQGKNIDQYISELSANPGFQTFVAQRQYAKATYLKDVNVTEEEAKKFYDDRQVTIMQ